MYVGGRKFAAISSGYIFSGFGVEALGGTLGSGSIVSTETSPSVLRMSHEITSL